MKTILFLTAIVAVSTLSELEQWESFKQAHEKVYETIEEEQFRFRIFAKNLKEIEEHNIKYERGASSYYMGINQFSDLTNEELQTRWGYNPIRTKFTDQSDSFLEDTPIPESVDWRDNITITVKDQGSCGACWSFAVTGAMESHLAIDKNITASLSEQELIDCSKTYGNNGCGGGQDPASYDYIYENGIRSEADYPYHASNGACKNGTGKPVTYVRRYKTVPQKTERGLQLALAKVGPVAVGMDGITINKYKGGIFDDPNCGYTIDHDVLVIGYGSEKGKDYWIIKNSWGVGWGEKGYIRIQRNPTLCGILDVPAFYPVI